ncbi:DUF1758 domain-containing protein [Trichonephila clavipes]|uniref:DUF1758 domain-containing protein n=1 Tax=Trichonephila clavipes TaxID=2585209 RepID=A0A8X6W6P4_TRICX|nr:DUF1758 domain-containing protein [Trichonephila clavipes]
MFSSDDSSKENNEKNLTDENTILSNNSKSTEVFLQTLIVCIKGKKVRTILDTGSQKSYVTKFIAKQLNLKCVGQETTVHGLFGGIERNEKHKKYVVTLSDVFNSYFCEVEVMDQKRICTPIPKLKDSELINELGKILGGPTAVFGAKYFSPKSAKLKVFKKASLTKNSWEAHASAEGDEMGVSQR